MDNMQIYNSGRAVPENAIKPIQGGAYGAAGLSDINPQWRIERMTEIFGPCGIGWYIEPEIWTVEGTMFGHVTLYHKLENGEWSKPVHGYGGTKLTGRDDDAAKSTITDAFGNACRYLGLGADVWRPQFDSKYSAPPVKPQKPAGTAPTPSVTNTPPQAQNGAQGTPASAGTQKQLATPFQVKTIVELLSNDENNAMIAKYGDGYARLSFKGAKKQIEELKARKGIK